MKNKRYDLKFKCPNCYIEPARDPIKYSQLLMHELIEKIHELLYQHYQIEGIKINNQIIYNLYKGLQKSRSAHPYLRLFVKVEEANIPIL